VKDLTIHLKGVNENYHKETRPYFLGVTHLLRLESLPQVPHIDPNSVLSWQE
jgi:hypothetical protein